jgi:beta-galactosidase
VSGAAKLLGPPQLPIKGGVTGFWVETSGAAGDVAVCVSTRRLGERHLTLRVE